MAEVLVILADGFEEMEALAPIDILRRAGASVTVAGLGKKEIRGSKDVTVVCDAILENLNVDGWDAVVLPGGMPGATNLAGSRTVAECIRTAYENNRLVCAICASPVVVLAPLGILDGKRATCYPGMELKDSSIKFSPTNVVIDGNVITGRAAGAAFDFALTIANCLFGVDKSEETAESLCL